MSTTNDAAARQIDDACTEVGKLFEKHLPKPSTSEDGARARGALEDAREFAMRALGAPSKLTPSAPAYSGKA